MEVDFTKLVNRKTAISDKEVYLEFSVLVPIIKTGSEFSLLFEVRSEKLAKQPNEICFPGGKIESFENARQAALRETTEELLILKRILMSLPNWTLLSHHSTESCTPLPENFMNTTEPLILGK
ncbi:MAG TPA: NUDIX domain-containing protein [Bacillota bacterium]|nr:NUDIX domain-containing protein [Bacillota bacterium]